MFAWYSRALINRPILTKSVSAALLGGVGDACAQFVEQKSQNNSAEFSMNWHRSAKFISFNLLLVGAPVHMWYKFLESTKVKLAPKLAGEYAKFKGAAVQMAMDQLLYAPLSIVIYFTYMNALDGRSLTEIQERIASDFWPTLRVNYAIWPAVQLLNFSFIPFHYRLLVNNVVSIFWGSFLSHTQFKQHRTSCSA